MLSAIRFLAFGCLIGLSQLAGASLKDQFEQQNKPKTPKIDPNVKSIQEDINRSWSSLRDQGEFYFIMDSSNIRRPGYREVYSSPLKRLLPVLVVDDVVIGPVLYKKQNFTWRGKEVSCRRGKWWSRPVELGRAGDNGVVTFRSAFPRLAGQPIPFGKSNIDFEVNFKSGECYFLGGRYSDVRQCLIRSFKQFKSSDNVGNRREMVDKLYLGMNDRGLEDCKVENP